MDIGQVFQWDANLIDDEIDQLFFDQCKDLLDVQTGVDFGPELRAFVTGWLRCLHFAWYNCTLGSQMMGLEVVSSVVNGRRGAGRVPPSRSQKWAYFAAVCLVPYAFAKLRQRATDEQWSEDGEPHEQRVPLSRSQGSGPQRHRLRRRFLWLWLNRVEQAWRVLKLANFLAFLCTRRNSSLVFRILGLRYAPAPVAPASDNAAAGSPFDDMFWLLQKAALFTGVTNTLLVCLPTIDVERWRNTLVHFGRQALAGRLFSAPGGAASARASWGEWRCPICGFDDPIMPTIGARCRIERPPARARANGGRDDDDEDVGGGGGYDQQFHPPYCYWCASVAVNERFGVTCAVCHEPLQSLVPVEG